MLKTIKIIFISLLLLATVPAYTFADDNETAIAVTTSIDINEDEHSEMNEMEHTRGHFQNEDERNAHITKTSLGAKIRVLQLKQSLEHQINGANIIIDYLNNKNESTDELESIAVNFEGLVEEIDSITIDNKTSEQLAEEFIAIKDKAKELSLEFKTTISASLTDEEKVELRELLKKNKEEHKEDNNEIRDLIHEYNTQKTKEILDKLGIDSAQIAMQIRTGELNLQDIKDRIRNQFSNINESERERVKVEFREDAQKIKIEAREREAELRIEAKERTQELREKLQEKHEDLMKLRMKNEELRAEMKMKGDEIEMKIREGDTRFELRKDGEQRFRQDNREVRIKTDGSIEVRDLTDDELEEENYEEKTEEHSENESEEEHEDEVENR